MLLLSEQLVGSGQDIIVPYQQGTIIESISLNQIKTHAIEGANHVTYVHNNGEDFAKVGCTAYCTHFTYFRK